MPPKPDRCTGHCCRNFYLPFSPEELRHAYERWYACREGRTQVPMSGAGTGPILVDIHLIAPMVVYLGYTEKTPRSVNDSVQEKCHHYRCKHLNLKTGDCTIYGIRPLMCRDYPGNNGCNYAGCTWKSRKQKKEIRVQARKKGKA